jgi:dTDP-4-dehydrorhamnose 3,5-epimerase
MPFSFRKLRIPELIVTEPTTFPDRRGSTMEAYKRSSFREGGIDADFVQDNYVISKKGVIRGLHYQRRPLTQAKLVFVLLGEIYDVAVDLREDSPTYLQWDHVKLSADKSRALYIPEGFACGFCVLSDVAHVYYKLSTEYAPESEAGIVWNDPEIGIEWPVREPILSDRDLALPPWKDVPSDMRYGRI